MGKRLGTIEICHPSNPAIPLRINLADFDPRTMRKFGDEVGEQPTAIESPDEDIPDWYDLYLEKGWRGLKDSAEKIGFVKPEAVSWEDAIDDIIAWEASLNG
jgi:hypothetical protein